MVRLLLFGTLEIQKDDGEEMTSALAATKHIALLAYLALGNGASHRRDKLAALLWPDLDNERARNALSKALHHIRRTLGEEVLAVTGNQSIAIDSGAIWSDAARFDVAFTEGRFDDALDLYRRGELMEGFALGESNGFEQWLEATRHRFRERAAKAANALAEQADLTGNMADSARWARVACEVSPYNEEALRSLLDRLVRTGDRAGAVEAYRAFEARISRDLDMEPSAQTRSLANSLRTELLTVAPPALVRRTTSADEAIGQTRSSIHAADPPEQSQARHAIIMRRTLIGAFGIAGIAAAAAFFIRARTEMPDLVAVGLLRNQTGNSALDPLADMATGEIVRDLTAAGQRVVDMRGEGDQESGTRSHAQSIGADKLLHGDMYRRDDSLVVQMKIVDSKSGRVLHHLDPMSVPVVNAHTMLDRLRDGVTGAVAALADTMYLPWTTAHSRPPKYAAFQEFMQGLDAIVNEGVRPAVDHLKKAIALDTGFVEAKIWLLEQADILPEEQGLVDSLKKVARAQRSTLAPFDQIALDRQLAFLEGRLEETYNTSRRLVAMAPNTPDAQMYLGQAAMATRRYGEAIDVLHRIDRTKGWLKNHQQITFWDLQAHRLNGDHAGALREWRSARSAKPADYATCSSGMLILSRMGRESEVDLLVRECAALPTAPPSADGAWILAGRGFRSGGHMDASRRAFERSLAIRQKSAGAERQRNKTLAAIQCELGLWKEAYETLRPVADTTSEGDQTQLGIIAAHLGDTATASQSLRWIDAWSRKKNRRGMAKLSRAFILLAMNRREEAIAGLREARLEGAAPAWTAWYVRWELHPLRGDPRFEELIRPRT